MSIRRALVVIDVQNEYFSGSLLVDHPPREGSLQNVLRGIDAAREADIPVVVVQHTAPSGSPVFDRGSASWTLHPEVARRPHDLLVEKSAASALTRTTLHAWLRERAIDTITLAGYMTQNCILATALEAAHQDLNVEVLADATGAVAYTNAAGAASAEELHRAVHVVLESNFAAVLSTDAWLGHLRSGARPARDNLLMSNLRSR